MAVYEYPRHKESRPSTRITVDTTQLSGVAGESDKRLCLVGSAEGGKPNTVYILKNISQAKHIFRGGELLDAIELAWTGSPDGGASEILAMRIEDAEPSKAEVGGLIIHSQTYGKQANDIQVALEDNTITNSKRLRIVFPYDKVDRTYDNLGNIFKIKYDGKDGSARYTIEHDKETGEATKFILTTGSGSANVSEVGEDSAVVESSQGKVQKEYDLKNVYKYTNDIINDINNLPDFEATYSVFGNKNLETSTLDEAEDVEIDSEGVYVTALFGDIQNQTEFDTTVSFEKQQGAEIENFDFTRLSGGSDGSPITSWSSKFEKFKDEGGYYLVPLTDRETVHAEAGFFARERSNVGAPMRVIIGGGYGEPLEKSMQRVSLLQNNPRVALIGSSGTFTMEDGRYLRTPGYMMASAIGGLVSGLDVGEPITFKKLYLNSLDSVLDGAQLDQMHDNGIIPIEFVRNRNATQFRIVNNITVYNDKSDPVNAEMSVGEASDFLVSEMKIMLDERFIGTKTLNNSASLIKDRMISFLNEKVSNQEIRSFAAEDIQVIVNGDRADISLTVVPMRAFNKIEVSLVYKQESLEA